MVRVCVIQADNRPKLDYLLKTKEINKKFCTYLNYDYLFIEIDNKKYGNIHPATKKIYIINDFIQKTKYDILIFLDSDAWIQNFTMLSILVNNLANDRKKYGCFSRDPYLSKNTYINSGSFIIKINDFTKKIYSDIINLLNSDSKHHNKWPYDQYYVSKFIYKNKKKFIIFVPDILNTPIGKILRHNWGKNNKMYKDLIRLLSIKNENQEIFNLNEFYDNNEYPNTNNSGNEYSE